MQTFETIRRRLQLQAANRFHCPPENLPQDTRLFIEWMAWELGSLHTELHQSDDAVRQRLSQRLCPDTQKRPVPVHGLAYAQPQKERCVLQPEEDVMTLSHAWQSNARPLFFTPLKPTLLLKAQVKYLASGQMLRVLAEHTHFQKCADTAPLGPGVVWVGIQYDTPAPPAGPWNFYVDWKDLAPEKKQAMYGLLPLTKGFSSQNETLEINPGVSFQSAEAERILPTVLDEEYMHLYQLEQNVWSQYQARFLSVQPGGSLESAVPEALGKALTPETHLDLKDEKLVWLKLHFPAGFDPRDVDQMSIQLNCFPVLNRRLDHRDVEYPHPGIETISLSNASRGRPSLQELGAYFLGLQRVFTRNDAYRPVVFETFREAAPGTYTLQKGRVEANDFRDLYARVEELAQLLMAYASNMALLPQNSVLRAIESIQNGAEGLLAALRQAPPTDLELGYYLHIKPLDPQDLIYVRYWITQGPSAQDVATNGMEMALERKGILDGDLARWVG